MSPGKTASQAGHAFLGSALKASPDLLASYHKDFPASPGTKVCLDARSEKDLLIARDFAEQAGLPHCLVVDSGCSNFFNGQPTVTALGIGPATKTQIKFITKRFTLTL